MENKLYPKYVRLGEVELEDTPREDQLQRLAADLGKEGFELLDDQKQQLIDKVKTLLIELVQGGSIEEHFSITRYLADKVFKDYSGISKLFSEVEGITLEQFFILQKIEKTKEWLIYDELSLSQIAFNLGYSSTQHLSSQFKRITGMTPSSFKQIGAVHRKPLDNVFAAHVKK